MDRTWPATQVSTGNTDRFLAARVKPRVIRGVRRIGTVAALTLFLAAAPRIAGGQDVPPVIGTPAQAPAAPLHELEQIRAALAVSPALRIADGMPTFSVRVIATPQETFAAYVRSLGDLQMTRTVPPGSRDSLGGGGGMDVGQLVRVLRDRLREREARKIRARIDLELAALTSK